ncbi:DUF817 domain-containing protein [Kurthia sibirica]|uniref:DUF817 domain-containing protein n=1 Tax=Kurthia sibirica TaxID=202750 RepID=A0A2U3AIF0_9BACL|nr:DUF817 domain-containing protein [Kurthia sibirica]PWI24231.1 DUF817 domain-containing protein [Kurthia sibirica]GEK34130.1 hypothetical protein KSI01_16630 [Kurthia sibirica]
MKYFWRFTYVMAISCIFPVIIFGALAFSKIVPISLLPRYDVILILCIIAQVVLVATKVETLNELKVICIFHIIGLALELYKTQMGSWAYPEDAYSKFYGVPLYSGFMYASVASFICQSWRHLNMDMTPWPKHYAAFTVAALIYVNFFTHHFFYDVRWLLMLLLCIVFYQTKVYFTLLDRVFNMPIILSFILVGFFIWLAENIVTYFGAWQYPNQEVTWHLVSIGKISSWFLLVIISIVIVAQLKRRENRSTT